MKARLIVFLLACLAGSGLRAQVTNTDSAALAKSFANLLAVCKYVDFADPEVQQQGTFYQAASLIVYRGDDKKRAWKDAANYADPQEKSGVDEFCNRINNGVNQDENYRITGYRSETESEGTWYVLTVSFLQKGVEKNSAFAFLRINGRFLLGDID